MDNNIKIEIEYLKSELKLLKEQIDENKGDVTELQKRVIKIETLLERIDDQYNRIELYLQKSNDRKEKFIMYIALFLLGGAELIKLFGF